MKRLLPLLLCSLLITSCVDMVVKIDIQKNWAGTMAVKVEMLDQMYQMALMQAQQSGQDMTFLNEDSLRGMAEEHGGKLRRYKSVVENGVRKIDMEIWLEDMSKLAEVGDKDMVSLVEVEGGWRLSFLDNAMAGAFEQMDQATWEQQMAMMAPMMTGLKWRMDISVPEVLDTNLEKGEGEKVTFELDFDKDVAGKEPQAAVETFKKLISRKWVYFKGATKP